MPVNTIVLFSMNQGGTAKDYFVLDESFHQGLFYCSEERMNTSFEDMQAMSTCKQAKRLVICREILSDFLTPIELVRRCRARSSHCFLLESALHDEKRGRYTFIGYKPEIEAVYTNQTFAFHDLDSQQTTQIETSDPYTILDAFLKANRTIPVDGLPPFTGGFAGYFAYESFACAEPSVQMARTRSFADLDLMFFSQLIVFDDFRQTILLLTNIENPCAQTSSCISSEPDGILEDSCSCSLDQLHAAYDQAMDQLDELEALLYADERFAFEDLVLEEELHHEKSKEEFSQMVSKAKDYILEGDIFQVVLSNPLQAKAHGSLFEAYRLLRSSNPSPYMFYFTSPSLELAGSSPETLVKLEQDKLQTFPLAGTRPRGKTRNEDLRLEAELKADEKENAEHNMLVDLGRNDLGKVSCIGSVRVKDARSIVRFSNVMHLSTLVESRLKPECTALDALQAVLPAGTLSGAPKIRAAQIISELEGNERGVYGGCIGYLDTSGSMDMCIGIRLMVMKDGMLCVRSGAGIVDESIADNEYNECAFKAQALKNVLIRSCNGQPVSSPSQQEAAFAAGETNPEVYA